MSPRGEEGAWEGAWQAAGQAAWEGALRTRAAQAGAAPALRYKARGHWRSWAWREVDAEVTALAQGLMGRGTVGRGPWVVAGPVTPRALALALAVQRAASGAGAGSVQRSGGTSVSASVHDLDDQSLARWRARGVTAFFVPDRKSAQVILNHDADRAICLVVVDDPRGLSRQPDVRLVPYHALREADAPSFRQASSQAGSKAGSKAGTVTGADGPQADAPAPDDEVFLQAPDGLAEGWSTLVDAWVKRGFVLTCAEAGGDAGADRREHQPTVLVARGATLDELAADIDGLFPTRGLWSERVRRALLQGEGSPAGPWSGALRRRLRALLGLARTRLVLWTGEGPSSLATMLCARLGLPVRPLGAEPRAEVQPRAPERTRRPASALASDTSL